MSGNQADTLLVELKAWAQSLYGDPAPVDGAMLSRILYDIIEAIEADNKGNDMVALYRNATTDTANPPRGGISKEGDSNGNK